MNGLKLYILVANGHKHLHTMNSIDKGEQTMSKKQLKWNFDYHFMGEQHSRSKNVIYKIENTISGKIYIGQTRRMLFQRWMNYKHNLLRPIKKNRSVGTNIKLKNSVQKHYQETGDVEFLHFSIVEILDIDVCVAKSDAEISALLCARETYHINQYRALYGNAKICNVLSANRSYIYTDDVCEKISAAKKQFYQSEEGMELRKRISSWRAGVKASEETRQKISNSLKGVLAGEKHPFYGKTGALSKTFGRNHTAEEKEKMSIARKGKCSRENNHASKLLDLSDDPLVSPDGELFYSILSLNYFCTQRGLNNTHLRNVINKKPGFYSHKGWRLQSNCT